MTYKVNITDEEIEALFIQLRFARAFLVNAMGLVSDADNRITKFYATNRDLDDKLSAILLHGSTEERDSEDNKSN